MFTFNMKHDAVELKRLIPSESYNRIAIADPAWFLVLIIDAQKLKKAEMISIKAKKR